MKPVCVLTFAVLLSMTGVAGVSAEPQLQPGLVTVELFTSQGCSACPPADKFLTELSARADILALTLAVDYWDYLGWRDTLARPENTRRQLAYGKVLKVQPYTPQIVVDGLLNVRGNKKGDVGSAIADRLTHRGDAVSISAEPGPDSVTILIGAGKRADATIWLVRYQEAVAVSIEHGENEGRTATYANVVQSMTPIGMWTGAPARFVLPRRDLVGSAEGGAAQQLAIIVQTENTGPILGAAKLPVH